MNGIEINLNEAQHIVCLSCYDSNVYKLIKPVLGFDYVKVVYSESIDVWSATLGNVNSGGFIPAITYDAYEDCDDILTIYN